MVTVKLTRSPESEIESIEISGHANSGPHGQDLVCAAVSAISFGMYNAISKLCHIALPVEQGGDGGYLYFSIPDDMKLEQKNQVQLLLEGMLVSLQTIETDYGQYIQIIEK